LELDEAVFRLQTVIRLCQPLHRTALLARQPCARQFFGNCPIRVDSRFCRAHPYTDKSRRCDSHSTLEGRKELGRPIERRSPQQNVAKLKADARNVGAIIGADKDKTQAYCQTLDLARQLERADQEKDRKKAGMLSQKIIQLQKLVGPEFFTLANIVKHLDLNSPDGREIALIIQSLNQSCPE
jgi:hypothetical protein